MPGRHTVLPLWYLAISSYLRQKLGISAGTILKHRPAFIKKPKLHDGYTYRQPRKSQTKNYLSLTSKCPICSRRRKAIRLLKQYLISAEVEKLQAWEANHYPELSLQILKKPATDGQMRRRSQNPKKLQDHQNFADVKALLNELKELETHFVIQQFCLKFERQFNSHFPIDTVLMSIFED